MVTDPGLALAIRRANEGTVERAGEPEVSWQELLPLIGTFWVLVMERLELRQQAGRLKQWLNFLRRCYPQAELAYRALRTLHDPVRVTQWMVEQGAVAPGKPVNMGNRPKPEPRHD
jgi:tRNA-dihydrouridine synthase C